MLLIKIFWRLWTLGLVHTSNNLPELQVVKPTFFAPCKSFFCDGFYGCVSFRIPALNISVTEKCNLKCMHGVAFTKKKKNERKY